MKTRITDQLSRGLTVVLLLAVAVSSDAFAQVKPGSSVPGGDDPGGVRGHIDIPEIGMGPPGHLPSDLFDIMLGVDDEDWWRPPSMAITPAPGGELPRENWGVSGGVDLFPAAPLSEWPSPLSSVISQPAPAIGSPIPVWSPSSSIPAPGATTLMLTAVAVFVGRRRRRED